MLFLGDESFTGVLLSGGCKEEEREGVPTRGLE